MMDKAKKAKVDPKKYRRIERFKFYNHLAGCRAESLLHLLPRGMARWRIRHDAYGLPVDKALIEWLKPPKKVT
jgi:hypothetical protein